MNIGLHSSGNNQQLQYPINSNASSNKKISNRVVATTQSSRSSKGNLERNNSLAAKITTQKSSQRNSILSKKNTKTSEQARISKK